MGQKGAWPRSRDLFFKFWDSPNIPGMAEDTNLKFFMRSKVSDTKPKKCQKGAWPRSRDLLLK